MKRMGRKMVVKCISAGLILCLGMCSITGCKNRTVDYGMEEEAGDARGKGGTKNMSLKRLEDTPQWQEEWTAESADGNTAKLSVSAKISVPEAGQMSVVEVTEPTFDASYKESIARQIFGGAEVYYNDFEHLPRKELEEGRADLVAWMDTIEDKEGSMKDFMEELEEELMSYDELLETAKDTYTPITAYDVDEYTGERDGVFYELTFREDDGEPYSSYSSKSIDLSPKDIYQVCPKELRGKEGVDYCLVDDDNKNISGENQCVLSEEEALEVAWNFVKELGLDYPVFSSSSQVFWRSGTLEEKEIDRGGYEMVNGYMFTFDAGIDEVSFPMFGAQEKYENYHSKKKEAERGRYSLYAVLSVTVTDKGVIGMYASNPIEITGVSEGVELLSVDEVKGIIKEQTAEHFEDFRFDSNGRVTFNKMELIYFRMRNQESQGEFSYIPVWRLSEYHRNLTLSGSDLGRISNPVFINAIDGSVIDFYDEV